MSTELSCWAVAKVCAAHVAPPSVDARTVPFCPTAQHRLASTHEALVRLSVPMVWKVHEAPKFVLRPIRPAWPTATHRAVLAHETPLRFWAAPLAVTVHVAPPSAVVMDT